MMPISQTKLAEHTRVLITGGCGFIGVNLVENLLKEEGRFIRIVDNLSVGSKDDLAQVCDFKVTSPAQLNSEIQGHNSEINKKELSAGVELVIGDILDADLALLASQNIDVIIHLAANTGVGPSLENPRSDCYTNVIGTLNYLEAGRINSVKRFVFASSGAPVGECRPPIHEEIPAHPVSPYGASKLAGEGYCSAYFRSFDLETVALRFGNVYGTYSSQKNSVVAKFIKRALENNPLEIYGDGTQTRDFIFVGDLVNAITLATTAKGAPGETFQIATNSETTVNELAEKLTSILRTFGFDHIKIKNSEARRGDVKRNYSDISKAKTLLNWQPENDLTTGLQKTVEWFIKQTP